ncbi:MAG: glycogen debranching protein GlgX [Ancalomicrobiaceae bacterium]|nr:glycogen debranching protein GlgX [Ancalomicrobiaceae bacterium]
MFRVDGYPTHEYGDFKLRPGKPLPFGATIVAGGVNFSVFSRFATACDLVLFHRHEAEPFAIIPFPDSFRTGNVFAMTVFDLDYETIEYGYRMDGPFDPDAGHRFDRSKVLIDPYARSLSGRNVWGETPDWTTPTQFRSGIVPDDFDWQDDKPLEIPFGDLVIYEAHVRGFTRHPSSGVRHPGTYAALREKIPYLRDLGVNCLELMPVHEFDEFENSRRHPETGEMLLNYWGYGTIGFFAPKAGLAATGSLGMQVDEFKAMVADLHRNGIEIILDIVFNHTGEGNENGPTIGFRGIDNKTYYMLTPEGYYWNFSGCGNTLNCNNPMVRSMILDCLRAWVSEYHIDGFRFDLAAILGRDQFGAPMESPPLLETLAFDPILGKCKLIAEAWDAGGLYQVGSFPSWGRWAEWNGKYRDTLRDFLRGESGCVGPMAQRLAGSPDLYRWQQRDSHASVNFVTCHDGFTLHDLVSYDSKHNEANGENNADGCNDNRSWNCGEEGESIDPEVLALRHRQTRNALILLLLSQGVPMLLAGDEFAQTQHGNNNSYCHDTELSWLDWSRLPANRDLFRFVRLMIAFRRAHPVLRMPRFLDVVGHVADLRVPSLSWHGTEAWRPDFSSASRTLALLLCGERAQGGTEYIYVAANMHWEAHVFELPDLPGARWRIAVNTGIPAPEDIWPPREEPEPADPRSVLVGPRSVMVLLADRG